MEETSEEPKTVVMIYFTDQTRASIEVHQTIVAFCEVPLFGSLRHVLTTKKLILLLEEKNKKSCYRPDEESHGLSRHTTRITQTNMKWRASDDLGLVREPQRSENISRTKSTTDPGYGRGVPFWAFYFCGYGSLA